MSIRFNAVSSYLKINQQPARQELGQHLQQAFRSIQGTPDRLASISQSASGASFIQALAHVSPSDLSEQDIRSIQTFLVEKGYNLATARTPSGVDGKYGTRTHHALQDFLSQQTPPIQVSEAEFKQAAQAIKAGNLSNANIISVQSFLSQKGYAIGSPKNPTGVDGIYGGKTHQALSAYEAGVSPAHAFSKPDQVRLSPAARRAVLPSLSFTNPGEQPAASSSTARSGFSRTADSIDSWFVPQFSAGSKNPRTDCGPASVAMILRSNGMARNQNLGTVRRDYMGVGHNNATLSSDLAKGIENGSNGHLKAQVVTGNTQFRNDPAAMLAHMRRELAAGNQVILLTKNMATMKNGHYVVVQGIKDDGSIVIADPGSKAKGKNRTFSYQRFVAAFNARKDEGMPNNLITVCRS